MEHLVKTVVLGTTAWACLMSASYAIFAESPVDEPPRYCTVFNHFVKSGGTSVKRQLAQRCWREGSRAPGLIIGDATTTPQQRLDIIHNSSVIMGTAELLREPLKAIGRECEYFTMLRDPIDRLVSAFYYCPTDHDLQYRPSKWCGDSKGEKRPIEDRLMEFSKKKWGNKGFSVMMPSLLCEPGFEFCGPEHARIKKPRPNNVNTQEGWLLHGRIKRILSTYTAVGIFEEWELSMRLFQAKVKSPVRDWDAEMVANPGTRSAAREELLAWAHTSAELHNDLAADMLLYDYALALFRQQTTETLGVKWTE